ncbi:MAG: dipeptidase [Bacteroidetes bacterium]|nr:dipeptidase [Rhodothermia bacterium]MCS7155757.1 dipeptidase [Bacteroidota bacterium]MCX7906142.1 dipeptidase [Bacteroidota bacterium]MDW8138270.1 dipeptidase [Bacteroidota bacterium]MDW8285954.1 dipeptidase [Bacteroidota bacterium]
MMRWLGLAGLSLACGGDPHPASSVKADTGIVLAIPAPIRHPKADSLIAADPLWRRALEIHYRAIVFDGHHDSPTLMVDGGQDLVGAFGGYFQGRTDLPPTRRGYDWGYRYAPPRVHTDLPRMIEGGQDAPFLSIWVAADYARTPGASARRAHRLIDTVLAQIRRHPDRVELATSYEDVIRIVRSGKIAALMGLEGGHALENSLDTLRSFYRRGVRYVTLTHTNTNGWCDSSQDTARWGGLNELGRQMVREMNRLGMLIDISHISDAALEDVLEVTEAPVIASHSSCRALTHIPRNLSDDQLRAIARNGGVVMINIGSDFVNPAYTEAFWRAVAERVRTRYRGDFRTRMWVALREVKQEQGIGEPTLEDVLDHIEHVRRVAGVDHVGWGTDFDGVPSLPKGLEDVTKLPWITYGLLKRGWSEEEIYKFWGANVLRVMRQAEAVARRLQAEGR